MGQIKISFILSVLTVFAVSCEDNTWKTNYPNLVNKQVVISDSVMPYNKYADKSIQEKSKKVITVLKAGCSICVRKLKDWQNIINKNFQKFNNDFYFIVTGKPNFYFKENIINKNYLHIPVYLDKDKSFIKENNLTAIREKETIILDENNKIIFYGSPLYEHNVDEIKRILSI